MTVRAAAADDADTVAQVHTRSWQSAYRGVVPDSHLDSLDWRTRAERWAHELATPTTEDSRVLVAETDGAVTGFVSVGPAREENLRGSDAWEIYAIYLDAGRWGEGLGSQLMAAALDLVPPASDCVLWVITGNERAERFYARHGFAPDGITKTFSIDGVTIAESRWARPPRG